MGRMKVSSVFRGAIMGQAVVNGRLITEFRRHLFDDGSEMHPAGTLVCEVPTAEERAKDYGPDEFGGILSETVTRFGILFWDEGEFTPRGQHVHQRSDDGDVCKLCGLDLRDDIHLRD